MAAGLPQPQQRAQDSVDGAAVEAAKFQAPVRDFPEFDQSILGADLVLAVVEVTLDWGKVQPVHLLCLWGNLNLEKRQDHQTYLNGFCVNEHQFCDATLHHFVLFVKSFF